MLESIGFRSVRIAEYFDPFGATSKERVARRVRRQGCERPRSEVVTAMDASTGTVRLGLRENLAQFWLLVLVNAFVGGMVGLERTVVPLIGTQEFGIGSGRSLFLLVHHHVLGLIKACVNLVSGLLDGSVQRGRRCWWQDGSSGLPVPFILAVRAIVGMDPSAPMCSLASVRGSPGR